MKEKKEKLYLLFYHLCITGIESLRAHMSQSGEVSVLDPLLEKLKTELQSFRYYCTRSLFVSLGPAEDSNKLYIHLTKGDWARIPLYIHPASVAELLVDCAFGLPNGIFPEYSYYIIDSVIAAGMPTDLDSLRKQATGIFYTTLQWEESNLFLFFVSLFRFFLHTCKLPNHGFRFQSALRILAKMTFRSAEKQARNREDEAYMLAFFGRVGWLYRTHRRYAPHSMIYTMAKITATIITAHCPYVLLPSWVVRLLGGSPGMSFRDGRTSVRTSITKGSILGDTIE